MMAIILNGTTASLQSSQGTASPSEYSICTWFKADASAANATLNIIAYIGDTTDDDHGIWFVWNALSANHLARPMHKLAGSYVNYGTTGTATGGIWRHWIAAYKAGNFSFYENGVLIGTPITVTKDAATISNWTFSTGAFAGKIAFPAYYNCFLDASDAAALGKGVSPQNVRPQSLRYFTLGLRDANAVVGATTTASNLTYDGDNPRIYL